MKKLFYIIPSIAVACGLLSSCINDNSKEADIPLAGITIASDNTISRYVGEVSTYSPSIEWSGEQPSDYTFAWYLNGGEDAICDTQDLTYTFKEVGTSYVTLLMTNKENGLQYGQRFAVTVTSPYSKGWLILSDNSGESSLGFVDPTSFRAYTDIYRSTYGDALGRGPRNLEESCNQHNDQITVLQESDGGVTLDGSTFAKVVTLNGEFIGGEYPAEAGGFTPAFLKYTHRGKDFIASSNGLLYSRNNFYTAFSSSFKFQNAMFSTESEVSVGGGYKAVYVADYTKWYCTAFWDDIRKAWLCQYCFTISSNPTVPVPYAAASYAFTGDGPDLYGGSISDISVLYGQFHNENSRDTDFLTMFKTGGKYYLSFAHWYYNTTRNDVTYTKNNQVEFAPQLNITDDTPFYAPRRYHNDFDSDMHLFFGIGTKLYFYHYETGEYYLYRDLSLDGASGNIVEMAEDNDGHQLGVVTSDGYLDVCDINRSTLTSIRQRNIDVSAKDNGLVLGTASGFPGTAVDLIYKRGEAYNSNMTK